MECKRVLLVYPEVPETFWRGTYAMQLFGRKSFSPPLGLLTVASLLPASWERRLLDLNISPLAPDDLKWADYVFLSAMHVQRESAREVINLCKDAGTKVVAGGPLFTMESENFGDVDHLVLNEAELTLPEFLKDLAIGMPKKCYTHAGFADLQLSPLPEYGLIDQAMYFSANLQFSRGCPHQCDFCCVTSLFGRRRRTKNISQILAELDQVYELGWRGLIGFVDDNLMCDNLKLKKELLPAIIKWKRSKPGIMFWTQTSTKLADDQEIVDLMYEAGFTHLFIGIETPDDNALRECRKGQNLSRDIAKQVRQLQKSGLQVQAGFIVGFDSDTPDIFERQFRLIQDNGIVMATVNLLQAFAGTELYKRLEQEGRILGGPVFHNTMENTNFVTRMDRGTLFRGYHELVCRLFKPRNYYERLKTFFLRYKGPVEQVPFSTDMALIMARCIFWLGVVRPGRIYFWRTFFWTCLFKRSCIQLFFMLAIHGYHFHRVHEDTAAAYRDAHPVSPG